MIRILSTLSVFCVAAIIALSSCSSGKVAFEHGNYYEAVITSVVHLRRNPGHKKSTETLKQAYPLAVKYYEGQANGALAANAEFKWSQVVSSYTFINNMYDEIQRSPGALAVISNPTNYNAKLNEARQNAAEEQYVAGIMAMGVGTRDKAKQAYQHFRRSTEFVSGYKDAVKKMEEALWAATVKVLVEPIPTQGRNLSVSTNFFNDKMSEYLHTASINQFVRFFTPQEAQQINLTPDHIVKLDFDEFTVGNLYMSEKEIPLRKDSVLVAMYVNNQSITINNTNITNQNTQVTNNTNVTNQNTQVTNNTNITNQNTQNTNNTNIINQNTQNTNNTNVTNQNTQNTNNTNVTNQNTQVTNNSNAGNQSNQNTGDQNQDKKVGDDRDKEKNEDKNKEKGDQTKEKKEGDDRDKEKTDKGDQTKEKKEGDDRDKEKNNQEDKNNQTKENKEDGDNREKEKSESGNKTDDKKSSEQNQNTETKIDPIPVEDQVTICHIPPGNDAERHTVTISKSALKAHLDHGDLVGTCESPNNATRLKEIDKKASDLKKEEKKDEKKTEGNGGFVQNNYQPLLIASASNEQAWQNIFSSEAQTMAADTNKVYQSVKATLYYYAKTIQSKGVVNFSIVDAKTKAVLAVAKIPGEYNWTSEWATFNGDERALTAQQLNLSKKREQTPPQQQDLFRAFTNPIFEQLKVKISDFYKGY